nr:dephospho-CoA kinase [Aliarcobacter cryaerophilus]
MQNRDNISKEEAMLKISNQMDIEEKKSLGTYIIDNSKDLKHLQNEVENLISKVLN